VASVIVDPSGYRYIRQYEEGLDVPMYGLVFAEHLARDVSFTRKQDPSERSPPVILASILLS
jgi:hypothetical protein